MAMEKTDAGRVRNRLNFESERKKKNVKPRATRVLVVIVKYPINLKRNSVKDIVLIETLIANWLAIANHPSKAPIAT